MLEVWPSSSALLKGIKEKQKKINDSGAIDKSNRTEEIKTK